jgi:CheY-like chemotaxis protein
VLEAPHGAEALRLSQTRPEPIDLLLTDLVMPGMSGREVADAIARLRPEARMLFMSGHGEDEHRERGSLAEGAPFLRKPFTPQRLLAAVREVLEGG